MLYATSKETAIDLAVTMGIRPRTPTKRQHNKGKQTHSQRVIKSPAMSYLQVCVVWAFVLL